MMIYKVKCPTFVPRIFIQRRALTLNRYIKILAVSVLCVVIILCIAAVLHIVKKPINESETLVSGNAPAENIGENTETVYAFAEVTEQIAESPDGSVTEAYPDVEGTAPTAENASTASTRTIITSRVRKAYDQNSVYIDMENILQNPELPVGCEITSLTILLRHYGFNADKTVLARDYLPIGTHYRSEDGKNYKDSFFRYFIGDPFSRGYGCFSGAIESAAVSFISDNGGGYTVKNISGASPDVLYDYVAAGTPVLCWATDGMIEPEYYETWYDYETGEKLDWYLNEHCVVLAGFDMKAGTVTLNDPMKGIIDYNIDRFETRYAQMYSQAIIIIPDSEKPAEETAENTETTLTEEISEDNSESSESTEADGGTEIYMNVNTDE